MRTRCYLTLFCSLCFIVVLGQGLKIDRIEHDFGVINAWDGLKTTEFNIINTDTSNVYFVDHYEAKCGCSTIALSKDTLFPTDTTTAFVVFDPSKSETEFTKSLSYFFTDTSGLDYSLYANIVGYVISPVMMDKLKNEKKNFEDSIAKIRHDIEYGKFIKYYYRQEDKLDRANFKSKSYKKFIDQARKEALFNRFVKIDLTVLNQSVEYPFEDILKDIRNKVIYDLKEEGIPASKVVFEDPMVELSADSSFIQFAILENYSELMDMENTMYLSQMENSLSARLQLSPSFYQHFQVAPHNIDTTSKSFKNFIHLLDSLNKNEIVNLAFFSESSSPPNKLGITSLEVSQIRGKRAAKMFMIYAEENGFDSSRFITYVHPYVGGPQYNKNQLRSSVYLNFQGVKIVQTTDNHFEYLDSVKHSFEQLFYTGAFKINKSREEFNELIKSIDQEIKSKGFANLKVESSASKQPNYDFRTKYLLAYERLQEFKKVLAEQLYIRGIDSRKINYISERSYVKGPEYLKSEKQAESLFIPFQYVNVKVY